MEDRPLDPYKINSNDNVYEYTEGGCGGLKEMTVLDGKYLKNTKLSGCCGGSRAEYLTVNTQLIESAHSQYVGVSCGCLFLAWLLFGCFGWHRCLAGKTKSGVIMAFTFGGLLIWWLIDLCRLSSWVKYVKKIINSYYTVSEYISKCLTYCVEVLRLHSMVVPKFMLKE